MSWKVVPCNVSGNVKVRVKSGNANQVYIENERLSIQSVTMNGAQATRLSYGAWQLPGNAAGATLLLTDSSGRSISIAVSGSTSDQDTGSQFPPARERGAQAERHELVIAHGEDFTVADGETRRDALAAVHLRPACFGHLEELAAGGEQD